MSKKHEKTSKKHEIHQKCCEPAKTIKNVEKPLKNRQNYRKTFKRP